MLRIVLESPQVQIGRAPTGQTLLTFIDMQSGIGVAIPMTADNARQIGRQLSSVIEIAPGPLSTVVPPNGGKGA